MPGIPTDLIKSQVKNMGLQKPDAYTPYAAGAKVYGYGSPQPTQGPVNRQGYQQRDLAAAAKKQALLQRMQAAQKGNYMSSAYLRGE